MHGDDDLLELFVGMTASVATLWHIVYPVGTFQVEGKLDVLLFMVQTSVGLIVGLSVWDGIFIMSLC